ncbi:hypothetical protein SteCoe_16269 [Stentor coeruleus]|uniref:Uncharacterized protein n=1 Tax=Stentor coeruleus TaxID=5963 RepID=A0A1R2C1W9_9CILI|nr:hypothetical protein SteCoe_16269 [Stentor coeruleus]
MTDKVKKPDDSNLEKHLNSKLFQKFLQKEGTKLAETSIVPMVTKADPSIKVYKKPQDNEEYLDNRRPVLQRQNDRPLGMKRSASPVKNESPFAVEEDIYVSSVGFTHESPQASLIKQGSFRQNPYDERPRTNTYDDKALRYDDRLGKAYFDERPTKTIGFEDRPRNKWQDSEGYAYKNDIPESYFPRDSELKGFSDYIPPGESFVYYESVPENQLAKPKPPNYPPFYNQIDPLITITANNQQIKDLESKVRDKDEEIQHYKQELDNAKQEINELEDKLAAMGELERRNKNLRTERDMLERKMRSLEDENEDMQKQLEKTRDDVENARYKAEDIERNLKNRISDLERELRNSKDRISDLERDLIREREKSFGNARSGTKRRGYDDDDDDYRNDDHYEHQRESYDDRRDKYAYYDDWKGNKDQDRGRSDYYDREYQDKGLSDRGYQDKNYNYDKRPEKISDQVRAKVGATNSNLISGILNWGESPKKNDEIATIENRIIQLQTEKKRYEEELAKIPEKAKKHAVIRRREEVENELSIIHSNIATLKIKIKQLQSKVN